MSGHETICVKCKYHKVSVDQHTPWAKHLCKHPSVRQEMVQDPVTGEWPYQYSGKPQPYCKDINKGGCVLYEPQNILQRVFSSPAD